MSFLRSASQKRARGRGPKESGGQKDDGLSADVGEVRHLPETNVRVALPARVFDGLGLIDAGGSLSYSGYISKASHSSPKELVLAMRG